MKRIRVDIVLSLTAVIVSICALFVSITEARLMKVQQKAILYPHLAFGPSYNSEGFSFRLKNSGAGIALVKSATVQHQGQYFHNWLEVIDHFLPEDHNVGYNIMGANTVNEKAILPGEVLNIFSVPWNPETRMLVDSLGSLKYRIVYCSILEDCWEITETIRYPRAIPNFKRVEEREFY